MSLFCLLMLIHASHATALLIYVLVAAFTDGCMYVLPCGLISILCQRWGGSEPSWDDDLSENRLELDVHHCGRSPRSMGSAGLLRFLSRIQALCEVGQRWPGEAATAAIGVDSVAVGCHYARGDIISLWDGSEGWGSHIRQGGTAYWAPCVCDWSVFQPVSESTTPVSNDDIEMGKAQQPSRRHGSSTSLDSGVLWV